MTGSTPDGKKIILKKRGTQDLSADFNSEPLMEAGPTEQVQGDNESKEESKHFYEGEIFEQFHRPLKVAGGVERLKEVAASSLATVEPPARDSARQREHQGAERQSIAEALAHQIFQLAQKDRETQLDIYLSAFNVALAGRSCQDARDILSRANEFFTDHYYAPIRERGERPEIYNQIIKRVGHAHAERLSKIVFGLDVEITTKKLWDLHHGAHVDKVARILDVLLDCTEFQVRALREEFLQLPYKDLARQLFMVLNQGISDAPTTARRTIGKNELGEHKRTGAFRARDQLRALRYLLLGRSNEELALVKRFYMDFGDQRMSDSELTLESQVQRLFPPAEVERLGRLLNGWSAHGEAEEIHKLVTTQPIRGGIDDLFCDPRDAVDRDYAPGIGPFLRRFKKVRLLTYSDSVNAHTFIAYQQLRERIAALSYSRFLATNQALLEYYCYELDPTLFLSLNLFDARQRAVLLHEALAVSFDLYEALQPIEFLEPRQCLAVQKAYQCLFGRSIREALEQRMKETGSISTQDIAVVVARYVDGQGRWPLNVDLLSQYRDDEGAGGSWDYDFARDSADENKAMGLGALLGSDAAPAELDRSIREQLIGVSIDSLHSVERAFYELTEPNTPLREALADAMTPDAHASTMLLFSGFESSQILERIHDDPMYVPMLRGLSAPDMLFIRDSFKRIFYIDLIDHVVKCAEQADDKDFVLEAVSTLLKPEVLAVRQLIGSIKREAAPEMETLRMVCSGSPLKVMAFERAYDMLFPSFRVHLKGVAARQALAVSSFAELMLLLEGVDPEVLARVQEAFDSLDIRLLHEILRAHRHTQKLIEESYDLLFPDSTLRHVLKELSVDPDLINEALLHLEGYCSLSVAQELGSLVSSLSGQDLAAAVIHSLTPHSNDHVNDRIPQDINWMDEMIFQIELSYRRESGESIIVSCRKKGVGNPSLEEIAGRVYGLEIAASAREMFNLIKCAKEGAAPADGAEARICSYLESRGPKYRERLISAYQSYWAHYPGFGGLLDDLTKYFKDSSSKRKLLAMFLSTSSDRKAAPATIPDIH